MKSLKLKSLVFGLAILGIVACKKTNNSGLAINKKQCNLYGIIKKGNSLSMCPSDWVIEQTNGSMILPSNINNFNIQFQDGDSVKFGLDTTIINLCCPPYGTLNCIEKVQTKSWCATEK